jgi:lipopolysaccharide heptosyltransferase II
LNINFQRAVDRLVGVPICRLLSLFEHLRNAMGTTARPVQPQRILIILLSEMGSLVLAHPMFMRLRQKYPGAALHVLMFGKNREVLDLMEVLPRENVLTLSDSSFMALAGDSMRAIRTMRALEFDVVIDCELFSRISSIFSYLSGAPVRVGFHPHTQEGLYRGSFINRPVPYNPYRHLSRQLLVLAAAIESDSVPKAKSAPEAQVLPPPPLDFPPEELREVVEKLHADFPAVRDRQLVLIYPGGGILPIRAWPMQHYMQLCATLLEEGFAIGVIGLKEDTALAREIIAHCQHPCCIDLTGYTRSIRHLLALFNCASLLITNDGGPGQFAALARIPALVFFGPETPSLYSPLADNIHCLYLSYSCSPCLTAYNHRASPCDGDNQCLKQISPAQALARARELLASAAKRETA